MYNWPVTFYLKPDPESATNGVMMPGMERWVQRELPGLLLLLTTKRQTLSALQIVSINPNLLIWQASRTTVAGE